LFEKRYNEIVRRGDIEKLKWLDSIGKKIPSSYRKRIRLNDKSVLKEILVPKWVDWELLFDWANSSASEADGKVCALCSDIREAGIKFNDRFVCEKCFKEIKSLKDA
jgi:hypothetical protein